MHAKTVGRLSGIFGLAVAFVAVNATAPLAVTPAKATQAPQNAFLTVVKPQHAAQAHLDRFFDFALSPAAAHALPRVQVTVDGALVWIEPQAKDAQGFKGIVADQLNVQGAADTIVFSQDQVQDWTFIGRDRKMYGSFQTRAQLSRLSPQNAAQVLQVLSISSTPLDW